jgi:N-acyl homoserine lactone hydrolase
MSLPASLTLLFTGVPMSTDAFLSGVSTVALIRQAGRKILFDTGPYAYRPIMQKRLERLGVNPQSVDTVVLSHVHWDIAGNVDLFPNADVVLHAKELAFADAADGSDSNLPAYTGRALRRLRLRPFEEECDLAEGLRLIELPGHTPGTIGLLIGDTLLASDSVPGAAALSAKTGFLAAFDPRAAKDSLAKALSLAEIVCPAHDRPFRKGPPVTYLNDYAIRIRFFTDPAGPDEELRVASSAPRSFATWPVD